jgi:ABC-type glycerol-3-phosphate transport system permease component
MPNYLLVARLDLLNTYTGLILPQVVTGSGIFMLRQTFTLMAAATMAIVPALVVYVAAQRYIVESFVAAGLKE